MYTHSTHSKGSGTISEPRLQLPLKDASFLGFEVWSLAETKGSEYIFNNKC